MIDTFTFEIYNDGENLPVECALVGLYSSVLTYPHPANGTVGQPLNDTTLGQINGQYLYPLALSSGGKSIFAAAGLKNVYMYHYPAGGQPFKTIRTAVQLGNAAVYPPALP